MQTKLKRLTFDPTKKEAVLTIEGELGAVSCSISPTNATLLIQQLQSFPDFVQSSGDAAIAAVMQLTKALETLIQAADAGISSGSISILKIAEAKRSLEEAKRFLASQDPTMFSQYQELCEAEQRLAQAKQSFTRSLSGLAK